MKYDLLIIGVEQEGIDRAISAAQNGDRVAVIGECQVSPSLESMRRAANAIAERCELTIQEWRAESHRVALAQAASDQAKFEGLDIDWIPGQARILSSNSVQVTHQGDEKIVCSDEMIIATGTKSWCPKSFYRDKRFVFSVESLLDMAQIPETMIVVGAGRTGLTGAIIMATLGVEVTVVDESFSHFEMSDLLRTSGDSFQTFDIAFRLGEEVIGTMLRPDMKAAVQFANGKVLTADVVLLCMGRQGATEGLDLASAGVGVDERGRIWCDESGKTWTPQITVVGDLMGTPRKPLGQTRAFNRIGSSLTKGLSATAKGVQTSVCRDRAC